MRKIVEFTRFLKLFANKSQTFKFEEDDEADMLIHQVIEKQTKPKLILKGNRALKHLETLDPFEKWIKNPLVPYLRTMYKQSISLYWLYDKYVCVIWIHNDY